jgi:hypothetical protein
MSSRVHPLFVRASGSQTLDHASVVALGADGAIVGRATLSRLYGARGEVQIGLAPTTAIALALIAAIEGNARARGLASLELDPSGLPGEVIAALRRSRPARDEPCGKHLHLIWPTTTSR